MTKKENIATKKVFVQFREKEPDGKEFITKGYFELLEETQYYLKIKSDKNILKIPWNNVEKIKESIKEGKK